MAAKDDPMHTLRRGHYGSWHLIKLDQPEGDPCWETVDAYGSTVEWGIDTLLTDEQVDERGDTDVVYTPIGDEEWKRLHQSDSEEA